MKAETNTTTPAASPVTSEAAERGVPSTAPDLTFTKDCTMKATEHPTTPAAPPVTGDALALALAATVAASDARLLVLCAEFHELWNAGEAEESEAAPAWFGRCEEMVDTPALTMEGLRAKAMVLQVAAPGLLGPQESTHYDIEIELALSIARDIVGAAS